MVEALTKVAFVANKVVAVAFIKVVEVANKVAILVWPPNIVIPENTLLPWKVESLMMALVMYCEVEVPIKISAYSIRVPLKKVIGVEDEFPPWIIVVVCGYDETKIPDPVEVPSRPS